MTGIARQKERHVRVRGASRRDAAQGVTQFLRPGKAHETGGRIVESAVLCIGQMIEAYNETGSSILGSEVVEGPAISAYGCLDCTVDAKNPRLLAVKNMVEKPKAEEAPSQNAIIGRYVLTPRIFEMIENVKPGAGGELQLTDAIKMLLQYERVYGFSYEGKRHDAGDKLGFLKATVEFALQREDLGPAFREWLKQYPV